VVNELLVFELMLNSLETLNLFCVVGDAVTQLLVFLPKQLDVGLS
jgi:hypothetical protein